jgi:hypothetical protein
MPVEGLTRKAIRQEVARNLMGSRFIVSTATVEVDAASLVDNVRLWGSDDAHNYKWVRATSGTNDGETRRVTDYTKGTEGTNSTGNHDATFATAFSNTIPSGMGYEMWEAEYHPEDADTAINRAINQVLGRFYKPEESIALHADGKQTRFDIPSEFNMISRLEYRSSYASTLVHNCDSTFDETTDASWTQALDSEDQKQGQALKITVADAASAGDVITDSIGSTDLSDYTHLEGWLKSSVALTAADYKIHLDSATVQGDGTDLESLDMPAATADVWTYFRVALVNPETDTAIISIGIEMDQDKGAHTVWFDDIRATHNNRSVWTRLPHHLWHIDQEADDIILTGSGKTTMGYALMKIVGGSHPAQMTADTDVATVPESYLIAQATYLMLTQGSRASGDDPEGRRSQAREWGGIAQLERGKFPAFQGVRVV